MMKPEAEIVTGSSSDLVGVAICKWLSAGLNKLVFPPYSAMAWVEEGEIVAAAVFNDYFPGGNISVHICAPGQFNKNKMRAIAHYVFRTLGCSRSTAISPRAADVRILRAFGFDEEAVLKCYFGPRETLDDGLVWRLTADDARRWLDVLQ